MHVVLEHLRAKSLLRNIIIKKYYFFKGLYQFADTGRERNMFLDLCVERKSNE